MSRIEVHAGDRYGRLVVLEEVEKHVTPNGSMVRKMRCRCDCGKETVTALARLRNGLSRSCGCLVGKCGGTHGESKTAEYRTWLGIKARCSDESNHNYGGRGIRVCDRWKESFLAFLQDMGRRPSDEHSIDRIDVNGDYEPGNCRWATSKEQSRNTRFNVMVEYDGETLCVADWAERYGISASTLCNRLRAGWDFESAVSEKIRWREHGFIHTPISKRDAAWYRRYEELGKQLSGQVDVWTKR